MPSLEATFDPAGDLPPPVLLPVGRFASIDAAAEHGLVILAMGLPYWLVPAHEQFVLEVEAAAAPEVCDQLARYQRESSHWPPVPIAPGPAQTRASYFTPLLWALSLLASHWTQIRRPVWLHAGALEPGSIFQQGEWWRPFTALFLHGDVGHLVSNAVVGVFVFTAVLSTFGRGRGWLLIAGAAYLANVVSAALPHSDRYVAIGASTAVFAGLGLLTGRAAAALRAGPPLYRWRHVFVPLSAGLILFALWGAGGPRVDFGAHVCGFATGLIGGAMHGLFRRTATVAPGAAPAAPP